MTRGKGPSEPSGVLFDAYGTLFDVYSLALIAEQLFPGYGAALTSAWRAKQLDYSRLRTLCNRYVDFLTITRDALIHSCAALQLNLSEEDCRLLMHEYGRLTPFPEALAALERLRAHRIPLAILSNGTPEMLRSAVSAGGMSGLFEHILSADQVRKFKTAPEVYQLGLEAFDCLPDRLVFVSSNGWDACCATWYGYRTFWVNRTGEPGERLGISPTGEGRGLNDLMSFLGLNEF
ncbi:MAG TPA: haloacid dehalogenase type II [Steroidobacteraceae bacterium]|nr:haloacid dehalogenase type II [Steroidobacteraceae bacterium]